MAHQYTRNLIRDTFVKMLNEIPLNKITVTNIANECDINRNTFYYYYPDTYAIVTELFQNEIQKVIDEYNDTLCWEDAFLKATNFALKNRKAIYHIYNSLHREVLEKYIFDVAGNVMVRYVDKIGRHIGAVDDDIKLIAFLYQSALTQMVLHWISTGMKEDPEKLIRRVGKLFDGNIELSLKRSESLKDKW
ncbi:transcriptional regulator, TetR family [Hathewaya proteolytica DSM 3090]|uniref:Transcriptional regulator, TetR family n=1 Tax=Hathewaya proteolytica DSM 3090 TaxID=1121331 RepID=A0A1M6K348_9CLOT|nr:TetR-like C-terminal domain-containing protein [Hathewaya proteolytica]SHJ53393.1 transcriptional regulator, TetR family [Hathewaya proteolytica DSM 3090]